MNTDLTLRDYQVQAPVNRQQRRQLLKTQGWYFHLSYPWADAWVCFKVYANGKKERFDDWNNHNTKG